MKCERHDPGSFPLALAVGQLPSLDTLAFVSLCAVPWPADLCSANLSVISDQSLLWQLWGLKLNTFDKFYKDKNLAKGLFSQLKHFIPQLLSGAFQGSRGSHRCLGFTNEEEKC